MKNKIRTFLVLLLLQLSKSENRYCPEAVKSVKIVSSCPISKEAMDIAASKKNCNRIAFQQNCTTVENFKYHCVINGLRNNMLEVCAPKRIVFGHCVEFNVGGGVIQDQISAPCNNHFPKCDDFYHSTDAYKYPDCYDLVSSEIKPSTTTYSTSTVGESDTKRTLYITAAVVIVTMLTCILFIIRLLVPRLKNDRGKELHRLEHLIKEIGQENQKEDESREELECRMPIITTNYTMRQRTPLNYDDDKRCSEDQFTENTPFLNLGPEKSSSYERKRANSFVSPEESKSDGCKRTNSYPKQNRLKKGTSH